MQQFTIRNKVAFLESLATVRQEKTVLAKMKHPEVLIMLATQFRQLSIYQQSI